MIIGFLGKGGSGKSTLSYKCVQRLLEHGMSVLAVDADHNMDLTYNLGVTEEFPYIGTSFDEFKKLLAVDDLESLISAIEQPKTNFSVFPADDFSSKYSLPIQKNLRLMTTGPHTEEMIQGVRCSHALFNTIRYYLPIVSLGVHQAVVVDEKAGRESVGTGITTGFDVAIVCVEPTVHSVKAASQIIEMLELHHTPYEIVLNKVSKDSTDEFLAHSTSTLPKRPIGMLYQSLDPRMLTEDDRNTFDLLIGAALKVSHDAYGLSTKKERALKRLKGELGAVK